MRQYVNVGVYHETREKLRVIAGKTNCKKAQIVADAINDYCEKILLGATKPDGKKIRK